MSWYSTKQVHIETCIGKYLLHPIETGSRRQSILDRVVLVLHDVEVDVLEPKSVLSRGKHVLLGIGHPHPPVLELWFVLPHDVLGVFAVGRHGPALGGVDLLAHAGGDVDQTLGFEEGQDGIVGFVEALAEPPYLSTLAVAVANLRDNAARQILLEDLPSREGNLVAGVL